MLDTRTVERLLTINKYGSIAKAADQIHISRSALVQQVKQIEKEIGFSVFQRDHKGVYLTEAGNSYLEGMRNLIKEYNELTRKCIEIEQHKKEILTVGAISNLKPVFLPKICREFSREYPEIKIQFLDFPPQIYFEEFQKGKFDICVEYIMNYSQDNSDFLFVKLGETSLACAVLPGHPLYQKEIIQLKDLHGMKLLMYKRGIARSEDILRDYISRYEPEVEIIDIDAYGSMMQMTCEVENAVLLVYSLYQDNFKEFRMIPVAWNSSVALGIGYHRVCSSSVKAFIEIAKKYEC